MRPVVAIAVLVGLFVVVPNLRSESNVALASNANQPTSPSLNCSDRGITLSFTAPTQTSPTVVNYEYFVSLGALSAEPAANDTGWKTLSPADSTHYQSQHTWINSRNASQRLLLLLAGSIQRRHKKLELV